MATTIKPVIIQPSAKHSATIIFLHGLGDTGHGWAEELQTIKPTYAKLICPTAPTAAVTINNGFRMPSWFDIRSLDKNSPDQDEEGIKAASASILAMIQAEIDGVDGNPGIPATRIILGGFSQGGALSLYTGLTGPVTLGGVVSLSGYLPISETIPWDNIQKPKILQCHGDADTVVPFAFGLQSSAALKSRLPASSYSFRVYRGMDHCSCAEELSDVKDFLDDTIPPL